MAMSVQIFISHSSADRLEVEALRAQVLDVGVTPYLFEHDPQPGQILGDKLRRAISASDAMIVLLTTSGAASEAVHQEIGIALGLGKLVIPMVEQGVPPQSLALLSGLEYVPFDRNAPAEALRLLTDVLRRFVAAKEQCDATRERYESQLASASARDAAAQSETERRQRERETMLALALVGAIVLIIAMNG